MSEAIFMIDGETYRIPQLRCNLPFINQPGGIARQKTSGADTSQSHILLHILRVVHIQDTPGMLLGSCRFTTPFGTFYKNGAATLQFKQQNLICYSTLVFHSHICFIQSQRYKKNRQFGYLWIFCSAIWGYFVRLFVDISFGYLWILTLPQIPCNQPLHPLFNLHGVFPPQLVEFGHIRQLAHRPIGL